MACSAWDNSPDSRIPPAWREKFEKLDEYIDSLGLENSGVPKRGCLIQTLHRAQQLFGYLPETVQGHVARRLDLSRADVYGVISFYSYFTDTPIGQHKISVCTGTACFVRGAVRVLEEFQRQLNIREGETTPDGKFFLGTLRCVGSCSLAPVVVIDDDVHGNMTAEKVSAILEKYR